MIEFKLTGLDELIEHLTQSLYNSGEKEDDVDIFKDMSEHLDSKPVNNMTKKNFPKWGPIE